jgi:hypothetical protein
MRQCFRARVLDEEKRESGLLRSTDPLSGMVDKTGKKKIARGGDPSRSRGEPKAGWRVDGALEKEP